MTSQTYAFLAILSSLALGACGDETSHPVFMPDSDAAVASTGDGSTGGRAGEGAGGAAGQSSTGGGGSGGQTGAGGSAGQPDGGPPASGGSRSDGGEAGNGGQIGSDSGSSGATDAAAGGAAGEADGAAPLSCEGIHPIVNGSERTCEADRCYCPGLDTCFLALSASGCCVEEVVCPPGSELPVATIYHPGDNETRAANVDIPFSGIGNDPQDGELPDRAMVWTSDQLVDPLATGRSFDAALPAGTHVVTLTVTDSDSNTGTDTITLIVQ